MMTLTRPRLAAIFAGLLLLFLVVTLPLAAALGWSGLAERGFSARAAGGSVWSGSITGAAFGPAAIGDVDARMSALSLLTGRAALSFSPAAPGAPMPRGTVAVSGTAFSLDRLAARLPLAAVLPGAGSDSQLTVQDFGVRFAEGRCLSAAGAVTADAAIAALQPVLGNLVLSGTAVCEGERLLLPLTGQTAAGDANLFIRIAASGDYDYDLLLAGSDPVLQAVLTAAGFAAVAGGSRLSGSGSL